MKKILIIEDETLVAQSLGHLVARKLKDVVDTCDIAYCAAEALDAVEQTKYDLVLIDIRLPDMTGTELAVQVRLHHPKIRILMISALCTPFICYQLTQLKVDGFIHKLDTMDHLVAAIVQVLDGTPSFCSNFIEERNRLLANDQSFDKVLGSRELQVLQLFVRGHRDSDIADQMNISVRTVETHRYNMIKKLGLIDKTALRYYAEDMGIF